jgi:hypothetical protein
MDSALVLLPLVAVVMSALAVAGAVRRRVLAWEWVFGCYLATALLLVILRSMGLDARTRAMMRRRRPTEEPLRGRAES